MFRIEGCRKNLLAHLFCNFSRKNDAKNHCVPLFLYQYELLLSFVILGGIDSIFIILVARKSLVLDFATYLLALSYYKNDDIRNLSFLIACLAARVLPTVIEVVSASVSPWWWSSESLLSKLG